jgi:hypothetical protein
MDDQIDDLQRMTTTELVARFQELHGYRCRTRHRQYLIRKNAWRLQANAEGDLSERARRRAAELADDAEVRVMAPRTVVCPAPAGPGSKVQRRIADGDHHDPRVPPGGSAIVREYKGRKLRVIVLPGGDGFEFDGERYRTLSACRKCAESCVQMADVVGHSINRLPSA